jgi:hypothetical protein
MSGFRIEDYEPVQDRIPRFLEKYPDGRVVTHMVYPSDFNPGSMDVVVFMATLYKDGEDERPLATGWAFEREGTTAVNRTSHVENCETSAIGRALANIGMHGSQRPSREEMDKVQRHEEGIVSNVTPIKPAAVNGNDDNMVVTWGAAKGDKPAYKWHGMTFQQVWDSGPKGRSDLHWMAEESKLNPNIKKSVRAFLDRQKKTPTMASTEEIVKLRELVEMAGADLEAYGEELRKVEAEYGGVPAAWVQSVADKMNKRLSDELASAPYDEPEPVGGFRSPMMDEEDIPFS